MKTNNKKNKIKHKRLVTAITIASIATVVVGGAGGYGIYYLLNHKNNNSPNKSKHDLSSMHVTGIVFTFFSNTPDSVSTFDIENGINKSPDLLIKLTTFLQTHFHDNNISTKDYTVENQAYARHDYTVSQQIPLVITATSDSRYLYGNCFFSSMGRATSEAFVDLSSLNNAAYFRDYKLVIHEADAARAVARDLLMSSVREDAYFQKGIIDSVFNVLGKHILDSDIYIDFSHIPNAEYFNLTDYVDFTLEIVATPNNTAQLINSFLLHLSIKAIESPLVPIGDVLDIDANTLPAYSLTTYSPYSLTQNDVDIINSHIIDTITTKVNDYNNANSKNIQKDIDYWVDTEYATQFLLGANASGHADISAGGFVGGLDVYYTVYAYNSSEYVTNSQIVSVHIDSNQKKIDLSQINWGSLPIMNIQISVRSLDDVTQSEIDALLDNTTLRANIITVLTNPDNPWRIANSSDIFLQNSITTNLTPGDKTSQPNNVPVALTLTATDAANSLFENSCSIPNKISVSFVETAKNLQDDSKTITDNINIVVPQAENVTSNELSGALGSSSQCKSAILSAIKAPDLGDNNNINESDYTIISFSSTFTNFTTAQQATATIQSSSTSIYIKGTFSITFNVTATSDPTANINVQAYQDFNITLSGGYIFDDISWSTFSAKAHGTARMTSFRIYYSYSSNNLKNEASSSGYLTKNLDQLCNENMISISKVECYNWYLRTDTNLSSEDVENLTTKVFTGKTAPFKDDYWGTSNHFIGFRMWDFFSAMKVKLSADNIRFGLSIQGTITADFEGSDHNVWKNCSKELTNGGGLSDGATTYTSITH